VNAVENILGHFDRRDGMVGDGTDGRRSRACMTNSVPAVPEEELGLNLKIDVSAPLSFFGRENLQHQQHQEAFSISYFTLLNGFLDHYPVYPHSGEAVLQ